jgi:hypothetical protein
MKIDKYLIILIINQAYFIDYSVLFVGIDLS